MKKILMMISLLVSISVSYPSIAAAPSEESVNELLEISGAKKQYEQMLAVVGESIKSGFVSGFNNSLSKRNLTPEQTKKANEVMAVRLNEYVADVMKKTKEVMAWDELTKNVYYPVYAKYFSDEEIKSVVGFYKSDVGNKFAKVAPNLIQESAQMTQKLYGEKISIYASERAKELLSRAKEDFEKICKEKC